MEFLPCSDASYLSGVQGRNDTGDQRSAGSCPTDLGSFCNAQVVSPSVSIPMQSSIASDQSAYVSPAATYDPVVIDYNHGRIGGQASHNPLFADPPASSSSNHFHTHVHSHTFDGVASGVASGVSSGLPPPTPTPLVSMHQDASFLQGNDCAMRPVMASTPIPFPGVRSDDVYAPLLSRAVPGHYVCQGGFAAGSQTTMPPPGFTSMQALGGSWSGNADLGPPGASPMATSSSDSPMVTCVTGLEDGNVMNELLGRIACDVEVPMEVGDTSTDPALSAIEQMVYNVSHISLCSDSYLPYL